MNNNIWVFEADICKFGTSEFVKKVQIVSKDMFDATHMLSHYIWRDDSEFKFLVELGIVRRLSQIDNLIIDPEIFDDGEDEYDGSEPIEMAKNLPDDRVIKFKCQCNDEIRVADGAWPFVRCPNCSTKIYRREVLEVGGFYIYKRADDHEDDD
jgi:predicted RNA-binding Zn-ribbon protein involved in translation (DUF1610 family)